MDKLPEKSREAGTGLSKASKGWAGAAEQRHSKEPPALVTSWGEKGWWWRPNKVDERVGGCRAQLLKHLYLVGWVSQSPLGKSLEKPSDTGSPVST